MVGAPNVLMDGVCAHDTGRGCGPQCTWTVLAPHAMKFFLVRAKSHDYTVLPRVSKIVSTCLGPKNQTGVAPCKQVVFFASGVRGQRSVNTHLGSWAAYFSQASCLRYCPHTPRLPAGRSQQARALSTKRAAIPRLTRAARISL